MKKVIKYFVVALLLTVVAAFGVDAYVSKSVRNQVYSDVSQIGHKKVGLLLGTSKYNSGGRINLFYKYRIKAALELYQAGKVDYFIVSGDNGTKTYNEPEEMEMDLIAGGVPKERIYKDYAGFRTLDSIVRCDAIFSTKDITIISQAFHNERALFIANKKGLNAVAYNAQDPPRNYTIKVMIREKLARVKMMLDLVVNKQPRFYGEKIAIGS